MERHDPVVRNVTQLLHGGDYNPDQWMDRPDILAEDIRLMKLAGVNAVSLGIFAWSALEPEEGRYEFGFFDSVMDNLHKNGIHVLLATPSGARPAWMAKKYPEVLRVTPNRERILYAHRHNHCFTSPVYREKVRAMNTALAEHYKDHPAVIAWHVSNEYGGECHCELCQEAFRAWLKKKYNNDLDLLNRQWWTSFWSHTYTAWDQIESPTPPNGRGEAYLHGLTLDWHRFVTHQTVDFMKNETAPLRAITPGIPVTTNFMEFYEELDYSKFGDVLDFVSWDSYPIWHDTGRSNVMTACRTALLHDSMRSYLHKPFLLMESTPSMVNWKEINKPKRPNMHKTSSLQAVAHGSDSVLYFQWRKGRGASEKFHGAVVDHVGHEHTRVFRDVASLGACLKKLECVRGCVTKSDVALIYDNENHTALKGAQGFQKSNKKYIETLTDYYYPFWKNGVSVDVIDSSCDFSGYKVLVLPMLYMIKEGVEARIEQFVANGGTVLMTYLSGMVNDNDLCYLGGFPCGKLKDVFGLWAEEVDTLCPDEHNAVLYNGKSCEVRDYCEIVHAQGAATLATYEHDFYKGSGAAFEHTYKAGKAYYIACRDTGALTQAICDKIIAETAPARTPKADLPEGVVCTMREDEAYQYVFVQNYTEEVQFATFSDDSGAIDMESGLPAGREIELDSFDTRVLRFEK